MIDIKRTFFSDLEGYVRIKDILGYGCEEASNVKYGLMDKALDSDFESEDCLFESYYDQFALVLLQLLY